MQSKKLVLFDIDGTLIRHVGNYSGEGWLPFIYAAKKVYGVDVVSDLSRDYHGLVDRQIFFDIVHGLGITKARFDRAFVRAAEAMHEYAANYHTKQIYQPIPEALSLLMMIHNKPEHCYLGVLTGNVNKMAHWKLTHVGIDPALFSLFVTGDEYDDRIELAKSVFEKVEKAAGVRVWPQDTYVLGDAVGDVRCAHAIGATSIIVTTGRQKKGELAREHPTLLVDSLMDERVLDLLGLKH